MNTSTADIAAQIADQRDRLTDAVGSLAEKVDTTELRARAEVGAASLLDNATDAEGRPRRGLLIGALAVLGVLVLARKLLK